MKRTIVAALVAVVIAIAAYLAHVTDPPALAPATATHTTAPSEPRRTTATTTNAPSRPVLPSSEAAMTPSPPDSNAPPDWRTANDWIDDTARAIKTATPFLEDCFARDAADQEILVRIALGGGEDPDIDHTRAVGQNGRPIDQQLEDCVRKSLEPMRRQTDDKIELTCTLRVAHSHLDVDIDSSQVRTRMMTPRVVEDGHRRVRRNDLDPRQR